jgi:chitinase
MNINIFAQKQEQRARRGRASVMRSAIVGVVLAIAAGRVTAQSTLRSPVITGYVFTRNAPLPPGKIDPHKVTRVNFAFANIDGGRVVLASPVDAQNLAELVKLRHANPSLTVLASVGGWLGSNHFSDVALTKESRHVFVDSAAEFVVRYDLDGLDVDWEYPGMAGSGHPFRAEDKQNFTLLMKELRERFDHESARTGRKLYLTIAVGAFDEFLAHAEMDKVAHCVDTVNLMTYDSYEAGSDAITGNHAPLFADPADPKKSSADYVVQSFERAGVPSAKILLGVPFYGRVWGDVPDQNHGLFEPGKQIPNEYAPYNLIATKMLGQGFTRYWDSTASVPYLYSSEKRMFVSYEDTESLAAKCRYVQHHKLGGVMFWEYFGDDKGVLLDAIDRALH